MKYFWRLWQDLDPALIAWSFDHCGITSKNSADYGSLFGHFVRTNQLVVEIMPINQVLADTSGELDDQRGDSRYRRKKPKLTVMRVKHLITIVWSYIWPENPKNRFIMRIFKGLNKNLLLDLRHTHWLPQFMVWCGLNFIFLVIFSIHVKDKKIAEM